MVLVPTLRTLDDASDTIEDTDKTWSKLDTIDRDVCFENGAKEIRVCTKGADVAGKELELGRCRRWVRRRERDENAYGDLLVWRG
jgi:hypothetical protein